MAGYSSFKAFLTNNGETITLSNGSNILGRGNEFGIHDRRVSRKHAEIVVNPQTASVSIEPLGVNPTWVIRKGVRSQLPNNEKEILRSGDIICLHDFQFNVLIVDEGVSKMSTGGTLGSDQDAATQLDVGQFEEEEEEEETTNTKADNNNNNKTSSDKTKVEDGATNGKRKLDDDDEPSGKRPKSDSVQISANELRYIKQLGLGSCGEVWECEWRGTRVAVKKIFRSLLHADALKEFQAEANILSHLRHPNIVLFMGTCIQERDMSIVTEFMSRGSLRDVLNTTKLEWKMILKIAIDAATGMNYLHTYTPPIIHRDLKSMNLLVDNNFNVKVSDFGLARFSTSFKATTFCGTLQWIAPELLSGVGYTTQVDVYSYGMVLWELITRQEPYKGLNQAQLIAGVSGGSRPEIPGDCPPLFAQLIRDCWHSDPQHRPPFPEILSRLRAMEAATPSTRSPPASPLGKSQTVNEKKGWEIDIKEVEMVQLVKANAASKVHKAKYRGHDVAIKELSRSSNEKKESELKAEFLKEVEVMYSVRSSYVVFFYGAISSPRSLVLEWMDHSLFDLMTKEKALSGNWKLVTRLMLDAAKAVNALHSWKPPIIHRKLKSTNLLMDASLHVKVSGFGLARLVTNGTQVVGGTEGEVVAPGNAGSRNNIVYKAPEVLSTQTYSIKSDVYSLGIIFWELATRCVVGNYVFPFSEHTFQSEAAFTQAVAQGLRPSFSNSAAIPPQLVVAVQRCWDSAPATRPNLVEVITLLENLTKEMGSR